MRELVAQLGARNVRVMGIEGARSSLLGSDLPPAMVDGRPASDFEAPADEMPVGVQDNDPDAIAPCLTRAEPQTVGAMPSVVVTQPVRSGQSLVFPEGDVTVVASVASGAEVIAGGSIHVYGTLRGRALAGTMGNGSARIFCRRLEAELIAIDGFYKTAEDIEPGLAGQAVQLWLEGDKIMAETLG